MSEVAILGAGAIGCVYGARLCNLERHNVVLCVRQTFDKLHIITPSGEIEAPARCLTDPGEARLVDWVLLAVKCHQNADVAPWLRALAGPDSTIAVLQNGVEHIENVTPHANGAKVLPVVVLCPADRLAPGRVIQNAQSNLVVPDDPQGRGLRELFAGSDIGVELTSDFVTEAWMKLCGNIARNPATALTGRGRGVVREPEVAEFCRELVRECAAVGRAAGANLPDDIADQVVAQQFRAKPDQTTSMLVDVRDGRPLEADGMTGAVVRIGARHGVPTPLTRHVNALLSAIHTG